MELRDYEAAAARTLNPSLDADGRLVDAAAGLAEEAGEVLGIVRKHVFQGRPFESAALTEELGDVLWCLAMTARFAGISLDDIADANLQKLRRRHPDGFRTSTDPLGAG